MVLIEDTKMDISSGSSYSASSLSNFVSPLSNKKEV